MPTRDLLTSQELPGRVSRSLVAFAPRDDSRKKLLRVIPSPCVLQVKVARSHRAWNQTAWSARCLLLIALLFSSPPW